MRICVLSPSYEASESPFTGLDPTCDPGRYAADRGDLEFDTHSIESGRAVQQVRSLIRSGGYDLFFNLCDGAWDEDRPGLEVVRILERHGVPYTGADPHFYGPTKETMKKVAVYQEVPTPPFFFAFSGADLEPGLAELEFPLIVKHFDGYSSLGMSPESICRNEAELVRQTELTIDRFGGALIEEFIPGREATVLVAEDPEDPAAPLCLVPVECRFPEGELFKHFDLKWRHHHSMEWRPVETPGLARHLRELSRRMFTALGGVGYARCDFRIHEETGEPYFLEINPNCGIFYPPDDPGSADVILDLDPLGHAGFIDHLIDAALSRSTRSPSGSPGVAPSNARKTPRAQRHLDPVALRYSRTGGYGLRATRAIERGERVLTYEEQAHHLVSGRHVRQNWSTEKRDSLRRYGYPLTDRLVVMWSGDPEGWRPINHSCDPNAWLGEECSLDVFARRPIALGEEIAMDYATFCGPELEPFECRCAAPDCRRVVRGTAKPGAWLFERYGSHVSDYIWSRRPGGELR